MEKRSKIKSGLKKKPSSSIAQQSYCYALIKSAEMDKHVTRRSVMTVYFGGLQVINTSTFDHFSSIIFQCNSMHVEMNGSEKGLGV